MKEIVLRLHHMPVVTLLTFSAHIVSSMSQHPALFPNPPVPFEEITALATELQKAEGAVRSRNFTMKAKRDNLREELKHNLDRLGNYVQTVSRGDIEIIMKAGMDVKKRGVHNPHADVPPVYLEKAVATGMPGEIRLVIKKKRGHKGVEVQVCFDEHPGPDSWQVYGVVTSAYARLRGLHGHSHVWVRVRGLCSNSRVTDWTRAIRVKM